MPKKQKSKQKSKRRKQRRKQQAKVSAPMIGRVGTGSDAYAPAAVSVSGSRQYIRFGSARLPSGHKGLAMHVRLPLFEIGSSPTWSNGTKLWSTNGGGIITQFTSGAGGGLSYSGTASNMILNPVAPMSRVQDNVVAANTDVTLIRCNMISPALDLFASAFVRYRITGLKFCYEPQSSTTRVERCVFAYANDPVHPLILEPQTTVNTDTLLALEDSIAFAPWLPWSLDCSRTCNKDLLYCSQTTYETTSTRNNPYSITDMRFTSFGSVACAVDNRNLEDDQVFGVLYIELSIELFELNPISTTRPGSRLVEGVPPDEPEMAPAMSSGAGTSLPDAAVLLKQSTADLRRR